MFKVMCKDSRVNVVEFSIGSGVRIVFCLCFMYFIMMDVLMVRNL